MSVDADYGSYGAVVFDLDGTLVRLAVDWEEAAVAMAESFAERDVEPGDRGVWEMLDLADESGLRATIEAVLRDHELAGARGSVRLPTADDLSGLEPPAAVCSLNSEVAARTALEVHGLDDLVDAVVGRDSIPARKPDPEPLLAALRALDVDPDRALFVGDSARDARTAERAGVAFRYVGDGPSGH